MLGSLGSFDEHVWRLISIWPLFLAEDGVPLLNAQMYLDMEDKGEIPEWFPSPIFQVNKQRILHASIGYSSTLLICYVVIACLYITCIHISIVIVI
jgi:hypothetical protein